ncbi:papain-like cysteine protease family protein [Paenibacillus durus]|uniref:Peptidase C39-like domain-containing protein n=2 Tax=Paenibacillus durus TaxID=44251 RepID=A0A0F7F986_PAEDU|nr:papain-like cysteine protease family protein [Paenibacillus durus]AKG34994.1 hypothetical protein VK70_10810 [Paenibacillus durus ATCC 35681]
MKTRRKVLAIFGSFLVISLLVVQTSFAFSGLAAIGAGIQKQEQTNWCWAAVSQGILNYYGKSVTQTDFVKKVKGAAVNNPASDAEVKSGLSSYGISSTQITWALSYTNVVAEIADNKHPIYAGWSWTSGGGHALLIKGIDNSHLTDSTDWVYYLDPADGSLNKASYSWVVNGTGHVWDGTLYNIHN